MNHWVSFHAASQPQAVRLANETAKHHDTKGAVLEARSVPINDPTVAQLTTRSDDCLARSFFGCRAPLRRAPHSGRKGASECQVLYFLTSPDIRQRSGSNISRTTRARARTRAFPPPPSRPHSQRTDITLSQCASPTKLASNTIHV